MTLTLIPLIPLLPLAGFVFCGLASRRTPRGLITAVACGSVLLAFLLSAAAALELSRGEAGLQRYAARPGITVDVESLRFEKRAWTWIPASIVPPPKPASEPAGAHDEREEEGPVGAARDIRSGVEIPFSFALDPLSAIMVLVVTGVGFLIHVYSAGYMAADPGYARYYSYLNLFTAMMLTLVLAGNFLVMFVGWEGVGLCSYLLIGFWYDDVAKAAAGRKAFIVNRIGDFAFILGLLQIAATFGTLDIKPVMDGIAAGLAGPTGAALTAYIALALFIGACGKSAQIPLYVWLPDAMAGPTPVSALIHAATMVTAGVYMVARCAVLYAHAPAVSGIVAAVGAATALLAATIGLAQNDIKKVLAYSTVSQLGLMFLGAGVGAFAASIFHLVTHAFFKALLFLGSGSVIHAMGGEQDIRRMGGLKSKLPVTYWTFLTGSLAIAGIPPLAGFFSKDEILASAWGAGRPLLWAVGSIVSLCTAFYMFRLVMRTFHGEFRGTEQQRHHLHESPASMTVPLVALAALSFAGGWIGAPGAIGDRVGLPNLVERWLEPVLAQAGPAEATHAAPVGVLMLLATAIAIAGIVAAVAFYRDGSTLAAAAARAAGPAYALVANRYWVDELYDATVLRAYHGACAVFDTIDRIFVDGTVNLLAGAAQSTAQVMRLVQTGLVRNYALLFLLGSTALLWYLALAAK